jgi:hypothetical protein
VWKILIFERILLMEIQTNCKKKRGEGGGGGGLKGKNSKAKKKTPPGGGGGGALTGKISRALQNTWAKGTGVIVLEMMRQAKKRTSNFVSTSWKDLFSSFVLSVL